MGYRSDVAAAFYVKDVKHFSVLKLWLDENFPVDVFYNDIRWFERGMLVNCLNVKWYDSYSDVQAFDDAVEKYLALMELDASDDPPVFSYEFVRVGENYEDIETTYEGVDCECLLGVTREITCVVGD